MNQFSILTLISLVESSTFESRQPLSEYLPTLKIPISLSYFYEATNNNNTEITIKIGKLKWRWVGRNLRRTDDSWNNLISKRKGKRKREKPQMRLGDDI